MGNDKWTMSTKGKLLIDDRTDSYVVRRVDWRRLKKALESIPDPTTLFANAGWALLGICVTLVVGAVSIPESSVTARPWLLPAVWIGAFATFVVGGLALKMQGLQDAGAQANRAGCISLLKDIEEGFLSESPAPGQSDSVKIELGQDGTKPSLLEAPLESEKLSTEITRAADPYKSSLETNISKSVIGRRNQQIGG